MSKKLTVIKTKKRIADFRPMINALQRITLRAFLTALVESDSPIPPTLQDEINKVGKMFANTQEDKNNALNRLIELAENECLNQAYCNARRDIQRQYKPQEITRESLIHDKTDEQDDPIENIAIAIFQAADSSIEAKRMLSKFIAE